MSSLQLIAVFLFVAELTTAAPIHFAPAQPTPDLDALFYQTNGWLGGDCAYSVPLTPDRTLWLFSDTWVGEIRDGKRKNVSLVNNTLALQDGSGPHSKIQFIIRHDADGKPAAFLTPADYRGWFWMQSGVRIGKQLYLFLMQLEKTGDGAFGFHQFGQWLAVIDNPLDPPSDWHVQRFPLPCATFSRERQIMFGTTALVSDGYLYIYGTDDDHRTAHHDRHLILARVATNNVTDFSAWRYYDANEWNTHFLNASALADHMATEGTVSYLAQSGQYLLIYTDHGLSPRIQARTSETLWGKWSEPTTVYECPEMARDKKLFTYAAKAHSSQSTANELIISYVVNSFDLWQTLADTNLYWPRFIRVPINLSP